MSANVLAAAYAFLLMTAPDGATISELVRAVRVRTDIDDLTKADLYELARRRRIVVGAALSRGRKNG